MGVYTFDFYCAAANLVIEIDGASHSTKDAKKHDENRDQWMRAQGIRILRFSCAQVEHQTQTVIDKIDEALRT